MAALPAPRSQTVEAIYSWWEGKLRRPGRRLGASQIGEECERRLWYSFRWANMGERIEGRMLRLFNRGHREEAVFTEELRGIGCDVRDVDPSTGEQFTFTAVGGHFVAKIDGVALNVPEAPRTWHNVSYKTASAKNWAPLAKKGVQAEQPKNWAQNQVEMHMAQLTRTLFLSVNKDTDEIYSERIRYSEQDATALIAKAERVIYSAEPLPGISDDPAFYKCKLCPMAAVCHTATLPAVSCRTCLHATPEPDGDGRWSCARAPDCRTCTHYKDGFCNLWGQRVPEEARRSGCDRHAPLIESLDAQRAGCQEHRYIPALLSRWGEAVDASEAEGWVEYRAPDGLTFRNGAWGPGSYTSRELEKASPALLRDEQFLALRAKYEGTVAEYKEAA